MKHNGTALFLIATLTFMITLPITALAEITLRYTDHEPYGNMRTRVIKEVFFQEIEKESQGRLKIDAHWNGETSTSYDALNTLALGTKADMGIVVPEYTAKLLPRFQIFKSFPVGPASGTAQVAFFDRIFKEYPQFNAELARNNLINLQFFLGYPAGFFTTQPNVRLDHLNGTKWRTASFWHQAFLRHAGGIPLTMPWNSQITDALRQGQLDGLLVNLDSAWDIHAQRAATYLQYSPSLWLGHVYLLVMNKGTWDALDEQDKSAIQRAALTTEKKLGASLDEGLASLTSEMTKEGAKLHLMTQEELNRWQSATRYQQVQAEWVKQQESQGVTDAGLLMQAVSTRLTGQE